MKRWLTGLLALVLLLSSACAEQSQRKVLEVTDYLAAQAQVDAALMAEGEAGYSFEEPLVVLNPYGNAPLSALAIFTTEEEVGGTVTAKGKSSEDDICGSFAPAKIHYVPIYGLYAGDVTQVELTLEDGRSTVLEIETEPIEFTSYSNFEAETFNAELYDYSTLNLMGLIFENAYAGFDSKADLRWLLNNTGVYSIVFLDNGRMLLPTSDSFGDSGRTGVREMDFMGKVYNEYVWDGGYHHDVMQMPNGNYMVLADSPGGESVMDYMVEIDPATGEIVWELAFDDLVRRDDSGAFANSAADWSHGNAVCYDEASDTLMVSCRNQDGIFGIRKSTKELLWIVGDPEGWEDLDESYFFTPVGENFSWQYGAHCVSLLSDGSLLLFDNGLGGRVKNPSREDAIADDENYSRAVRYKLDVENMTIELVWEYGREWGPAYYSSVISSVFCLDEESETYCINYGSVNPDYGSAPYTTNVYGTKAQYVVGDERVWEMSMRGGCYRDYRAALYQETEGFDINAQARWFGDLGTTPCIEGVQADVEGAQALPEGTVVKLMPYNAVNVGGRFILEGSEAPQSAAIVLVDSEGNQSAYNMRMTSAVLESGVLIMPKGWVSATTLPEGDYAIYLVMDGVTFDTNCNLQV